MVQMQAIGQDPGSFKLVGKQGCHGGLKFQTTLGTISKVLLRVLALLDSVPYLGIAFNAFPTVHCPTN